jgi:hypothetical protein
VKASDIEGGDKIDGWTVTEAALMPGGLIDEKTYPGGATGYNWRPAVVLLTLERVLSGEAVWYAPKPPAGVETKTETRRTWYRADEDV